LYLKCLNVKGRSVLIGLFCEYAQDKLSNASCDAQSQNVFKKNKTKTNKQTIKKQTNKQINNFQILNFNNKYIQ
jgi:hypothetical protein